MPSDSQAAAAEKRSPESPWSDDKAEGATEPEWQAVFDDASKSWYWWNTKTNETTWDDPTGGESKEAAAGTSAEASKAKEDGKTDAPAAEKKAGEADGAQAATNPAQAGDPTSADYYNSQEYYNWYYSQMGAAAPSASDAAPGTSGTEPGEITETPTSAAPADASGSNMNAAAAYAAYAASYAAAASSMLPALVASQYMQQVTPAAESFKPDDIHLVATFNAKTGKFQADRTGSDSYFAPNAKAERQMAHFFDIDRYQEERNLMKLQQQLMPEGKKKLTKKDIDRFKKKNKEKKLRSLLKRFGPDD
ncbi:hypothetical protein HDU96_008181 [Phlyctochytrium bullatum]|nr:hypothetical protein HDU96_008181 [Phlyctochytrium bullatum]